MHTVQVHSPETLSRAQIRALNLLWQSVWPVDCFDLDAYVARFHDRSEIRPERRLHVIWEGDAAIAAADTFQRVIRTTDGERPVMALASVCSAPTRRGEGLGRLVTLSAFERVAAGEFEVALFQTPVPAFYELLGSRLITNPFENHLNPDNPTANPFWDPCVMIYPANADWSDGPIDLNGPGY